MYFMAEAIQLFTIRDPKALVSTQSLWIPEYSIILIAIVATVYNVVAVVFAVAEEGVMKGLCGRRLYGIQPRRGERWGVALHQNEVINMAAECRKTEADNVS